MRKLLLLVLGLGMSLLFTGCAYKGGAIAYKIDKDYLSPEHAATIEDKEKPDIYKIVASRSGGSKISREAMRKEAVAALFQSCAVLGLKIKKPYFYIIKPSKFASFGISTMAQADKMCINGSGGVLTTLFSIFDNTGINRGCEFGIGGDNSIGTFFAKVAFFKNRPLNVPTFDSNEVLTYMKKHGLYDPDVEPTKTSPDNWTSDIESNFSYWDRMTK